MVKDLLRAIITALRFFHWCIHNNFLFKLVLSMLIPSNLNVLYRFTNVVFLTRTDSFINFCVPDVGSCLSDGRVFLVYHLILKLMLYFVNLFNLSKRRLVKISLDLQKGSSIKVNFFGYLKKTQRSSFELDISFFSNY